MATISSTCETEIWSRLFTVPSSIEAAKYFVGLDFSPNDRARIHDLLTRNQDGALTPPEVDELNSFLRVGRQLDLLRSKARIALSRFDEGR